MSRTVDVFIRTPQRLDRLAAELGQITGGELEAVEDGFRLWWNEGALGGTLESHRYLDDGLLNLSRYPFVLTLRVEADNLANSEELAKARQVAEVAQLRLGAAVMVVQDLERRDAPLSTGPRPDGV